MNKIWNLALGIALLMTLPMVIEAKSLIRTSQIESTELVDDLFESDRFSFSL